MRMARIAALLVCLAGACASGCMTGQPHAQTGWRAGWEVVRPPLVVSGPKVTAVTSSVSGGSSAGLVGIDQGTTLTEVPAADPSALIHGRFRGRVRAGIVGSPPDCNLQEVCDRIEKIERRLNGAAAPVPPPRDKMPPGGSE